ncbi:hypothetical protein Tco_0210250 [Tanacetum coccineum]
MNSHPVDQAITVTTSGKGFFDLPPLSGVEAWELCLAQLSFFLDSLFCVCLSFNMSIHGYSDEDYDAGSDGDNVTLISKLDISNNRLKKLTKWKGFSCLLGSLTNLTVT